KSENKKYGSATCRLMRWDFEKVQEGNFEASKTKVIDSLGIGITKSHHFVDIGQGQSNSTPYLNLKEIFAPSGALAIFRKSVLDDIAFTNDKGIKEYFDELLHYKNDIDLAYRLQWAGHPCLFIPQITVYHDRQVGLLYRSDHTIINRLITQAGKSKWAKGNSFFGDIVVLKKNFTKNFSWNVRLRTWWSRLLKFIFALFLDVSLLKQYRLVNKFRPEINLKKRAIVRRNSPSYIEKLML
ncbi:hypothetical protein KKF04_02250, partial [Patescibacteria group bacterium]|nr:hypothetical protein [Patescibacteria group bacterium]